MSNAAPLQIIPAKPQPVSNVTNSGLLLQRKCACGTSATSGGGDCEECKGDKKIQTKMAVGSSADPLEREADRVADQVMAETGPSEIKSAPLNIQRQATQTCGDVSNVPPSVDNVLANSGNPLDGGLRKDMEQRFGHDFSRVRIHSGGEADRSAREVNAIAYTVGHDMVFASGQFAPRTQEGRRLIAHELTHVVQQTGANRVSSQLLQRHPGPDPIRQGKILSLDDIKSDAVREKARKPTGQTAAKVCRSISAAADKKNCPATLEPGLTVQIIAEHAGGTWLQITTPEQIPEFGPKEPLYVLAVFVKELTATKAAPDKPADVDPVVEEPATADEEKQRTAEADRVKAAEKKIANIVVQAKAALQTASSLMTDVDQVDLDLVDIVLAQGEGATETAEILEDLGSLIAGLPQDHQDIIVGLAYLEMQMYAQNAQHLYVLNKNVTLDLPSEVTNAEEVEEELDGFAEWHEDWIVQNSYVGELAADFFALLTGLEEKIEVNLVAARELIDYEKNLKEENEALTKINEEMESFDKQIKGIRNKSRLIKVLEVLSYFRGRGRGGLKRPPKPKGGKPPKGGSNAPKGGTKAKPKPAKARKQYKKAKGQTSPKKAKQRKKKDKKKKERKGMYPICWPTLLGPPMLAGIPVPTFVRVPGADRDESANQQLRMESIRNKGPVAKNMHLHHSVPLFLGGLDASPMNLTLIPKKNHLTGHSWLAHQPQMAKPPGGLKPLSTNLYDHPALTMYRLKGFKASRTEVC